MKNSFFKIAYCSEESMKNFKNGSINIGELLMSADETLRGGLDHYEETQKQVKIYDRGCNGRVNDLIIRAGKF